MMVVILILCFMFLIVIGVNVDGVDCFGRAHKLDTGREGRERKLLLIFETTSEEASCIACVT